MSFPIALSALFNKRSMYVQVQIIHLINLPGYKRQKDIIMVALKLSVLILFLRKGITINVLIRIIVLTKIEKCRI